MLKDRKINLGDNFVASKSASRRAENLAFCNNGEEVRTLTDDKGLPVKTTRKKQGLISYWGNDENGQRVILFTFQEQKEKGKGKLAKDIYDDYIFIPNEPTDEERKILDIIVQKVF